ncbi:peroxin [Rhizophlyctis rosea]|nr:peroxin [Rhizophlyctis rosea]
MSWLFSSIGDRVRRNRNRLLWLGGTISGGCALFKFAEWKWTEFQQKRELEQGAKANVKRRFEQNLNDCAFAVGSLLPTLGENLFAHLDVERVTAKLKETKTAKTSDGGAPLDEQQRMEQKLALWEEVKVLGFTRTIAAVYLVTLLIIFTHLQLNLLGRFFYLDSVSTFAQQSDFGNGELYDPPADQDRPPQGVSDETERRYLTFSWYVLNVGWTRCVERVRRVVEEVMGSVGLKEPIGSERLAKLVNEVRKCVEFEDVGEIKAPFPFVECLLPPEGQEAEVIREGGAAPGDDAQLDADFTVDPELRVLLNETRDFLESPDFQKVLHKCLDTSFDLLMKHTQPAFEVNSSVVKSTRIGTEDMEASQENIAPPSEKELPLAGVIPVISRLAHQILNGMPNAYVEAVSKQPDLKAFAVVVYTGWESGASGY